MNLFQNRSLAERYRPATWAEVVGQDRIVKQIRYLRERNALGGRGYWLSGLSGTGKTTIARLLASEIAGEWDIEELDAGKLTMQKLDDVEHMLQYRGLDHEKGGRAIIVNEAHGLRRDVIRQLLVVIERLPAHAIIIFTTTTDGQQLLLDGKEDSSPLMSRCLYLPLERDTEKLTKAFAARALEIAIKEGMDGAPLTAYKGLVRGNGLNFRAVLQAVETVGASK